MVSLGATFYASVAVERLLPPPRSSYKCAAYARWGVALAVINTAWGVAEIALLE